MSKSVEFPTPSAFSLTSTIHVLIAIFCNTTVVVCCFTLLILNRTASPMITISRVRSKPYPVALTKKTGLRSKDVIIQPPSPSTSQSTDNLPSHTHKEKNINGCKLFVGVLCLFSFVVIKFEKLLTIVFVKGQKEQTWGLANQVMDLKVASSPYRNKRDMNQVKQWSWC